MFKVGDKVRQKNGICFNNGHYIDTISEWKRGSPMRGGVWLSQADAWIYENELELATDSPVRETTIVKKEIVPGTYGKVVIGQTSDINRVYLTICQSLNKKQLAEAIKTLQLIHDAME